MIFLLVVITVLGLIHGYVGLRIIPAFGIHAPWQLIVWIAIILLAILPISGPVLRYQGFENRFTDFLSWIGYTSLGFFFMAFIIILMRDFGFFIWFKGSALLHFTDERFFSPERRQVLVYLTNMALLFFTSGLSFFGFYRARGDAEVVEVDIPIEDLPAALEGIRIVQISDIHVGPTIKRDFVERIVRKISELNPDIIALTGDLVDGSVSHLASDVSPLADLEAPYGKYFITGNHEYYSGVNHWLKKTHELGFKNLINENVSVHIKDAQLNISGVTDLHAHQVDKSHRTDPEKALSGVSPDTIKIMLAHQPGSIHDANRLGVHLMLAGHTHGGQFMPFNLAVSAAHPYIAGKHNHQGTWIYVNRGTGYWGPPLRIGIPNEITVLTLRKKISDTLVA